MKDLLSTWVDNNRIELEAQGFRITLSELHIGRSRSVDLDGSLVGGRITYWSPDQFEFQFHCFKTGNVLVVEERNFSSVDDLSAYFKELQREKLSLLY